MKKLMILGAGRGQIRLINIAKQMGYETIVASIPGDYPGFKLADKICYVDISNKEEVLSAAIHNKIDGIITTCLDTGIESLGYVCDKLNLCGPSYEVSEMSNNKLLTKDKLYDNNIITAKYKRVNNINDVEEFVKKYGFPIVLKAVDLQGNNGVYICYTIDESKKKLENIFKLTKKNYCMVEEYLDGEDFGAEALVYNSEVLFILPTGEISISNGVNIPNGHFFPLSPSDNNIIIDVVKKIIKKLSLNNCAVNIDFKKNGKDFYVIEYSARAGANGLPNLVSIYLGLEYEELIVSVAMNDSNMIKKIKNKINDNTSILSGCSKMICSEKSGILEDILYPEILDEDVTCLSFFCQKGDQIRKFESSKDCIGEIVAKGNSVEKCIGVINSTIDSISIKLK